jgi:hypothetical protein
MSQIKSVGDIRNRISKEKVAVPEWGDPDTFVWVRGLTAREFEKWQQSLMAQSKGEAPRATLDRLRGNTARLVIAGACDENGEPVFSDRDQSALLDMNNRALSRVAEMVQKLSGIGDEEEIVAELEGNSETGQTLSSTSAWPATSASEQSTSY